LQQLCIEYPDGTIKNLNTNRGFGFLRAEDADRDMFFHRHNSKNFDALSEGDVVEFDVRESSRHPGESEGYNVQLRSNPERDDSGLERYLDPTN
jgi:cold shock CspA family protein